MASKKAEKLAQLTVSLEFDSPLPAPSHRTKRNHSSITALTTPESPLNTDKSFELITRDPSQGFKSKEFLTKRVKSLNFTDRIKSGAELHDGSVDPNGAVFCGYRMKSQRLSSANIILCLQDREIVPLSNLEAKIQKQRRFWRSKSEFTSDFVVTCVVCHVWMKDIPQDDIKKKNRPLAPSSASESRSISVTSESASDKSNRFLLVVRLSDLKRTSVCLILEPNQQAGFDVSFGDVLAILNPGFVNAVDGEGAVLKIRTMTQICILGQSAEIGVCLYRNPAKSGLSGSKSSEKALPTLSHLKHGESEVEGQREKKVESAKREAVCPNFINIDAGEYCEFHMYEMFDNVKSNRMVLNDASSGALSIKKKRKEFASAAKHLSDGIFVLVGLKWRISERGVKIVPSNEQGVLPTATEMYERKHCESLT